MEFLLPGRKAPIIYESCLESTNRSLKEMARQGAAEGTVLIAGRQTGAGAAWVGALRPLPGACICPCCFCRAAPRRRACP